MLKFKNLLLIFILFPLVISSNQDDDFELDSGFEPGFSAGGVETPRNTLVLRRFMGVPDTEATIGKVFKHPIPSDAFEGPVDRYKVENLPAWLSFNPQRNLFLGVPLEGSRGFNHITVVAFGADGSQAVDKFTIEIYKQKGSELLSESRCERHDDVTVLSVEVQLPNNYTPKDRVKLIHNVKATVGVKGDMISLLSIPSDYDPLDDRSALMGHASASKKIHNPEKFSPMMLQWSVGCDGELSKKGLKEKNLVKGFVSSGKTESKMSKIIGVHVDSWHVTRVEPNTMRIRRDLSDFSGDGYTDGDSDGYGSDYDDYYYDYDNINLFDLANKNKDKQIDTESIDAITSTPVLTSSFTRTGDSPHTSSRTPGILTTPVLIPAKPTDVIDTPLYSPTPSMIDPYTDTSLLVRPTTSADYTSPFDGPTATFGSPSPPVIKPAPTSIVDETIISSVINFAPRVTNRVQKLDWEVGNVYRYRIPENTFEDMEDGNTRKLTLVLKDFEGRTLGRDSWIQFDPAKQEIYALPLEDHVSRSDFKLEAIDKERKSVTEFVKIRVIQPQQARNFHHQFSAVLKLVKLAESDFAYSLDWQVKAVEKIAKLYGDGDLGNINVRNISSSPVGITWTNVSLVDSTSTVCPTEQLEHASSMLIEANNDPTRGAKKAFLPEFQLKRVQAVYYQPCESLNHHHRGGHHQGGRERQHHGGHTTEEDYENDPPIIRNHIDSITAKAGSLYRYQVPIDTCYDREEGDSRGLHLKLWTDARRPPPKNSWLQFDEANQEFFGLPLADDIGRRSYILDCIDRENLSASNALFARVVEQYDEHESEPIPPVRFSLTAAGVFNTLNSNAYAKAKLVELIAAAFGDRDTSNVIIESLEAGSIKVGWVNNSLPVDPCPQEEIMKLRRVMTDENGVLKKSFIESFTPDFKVVGGDITPDGACLSGDTPTHPEEPFIEGTAGSAGEVSEPTEDYLLTFIVPAVIIAVMLLLAAIIACCLYRRRRYGKMSMTDDRTFVSKGIPIIFAEELDDHRNDSVKTPTVLREEKPPLPPPEYQRGKDGRSATPPSMRASREMGNGSDQPYQPPPPFTASNGGSRNTRPAMPPTYRKPPNYCPP